MITPQVASGEKIKSTESTVVERETVFKIDIESEPHSSEDFYGKDVDDEEDITVKHQRGVSDNRSCTSEKVALKTTGMLEPNDDADYEFGGKASECKESMGSLERQIQQIVLSRDLLQNMEIDLKEMNMKNGSVLEPSEEQTRGCMMLRQGGTLDENYGRSGFGMNTAQELQPSLSGYGMNTGQEMEPSLQNDQLDLSGDEQENQVHGGEFDPNQSNISFG